MSRDLWDPKQYARYGDERSRPFFDLLGQVAAADPKHVTDLGCGSGALTATLLERWPDAIIEGVDGSPSMIEEARPHEVPGRLTFRVGDVRGWRAEVPQDVIVSNAVLHWVPDHVDRFPRLVDALTPGGWLAFQVPGNFEAPSHELIREQCATPRWSELVGGLALERPVRDPAGYLDALAGLGCRVDAWETTYLHVLQGEDPVVEWVKGTALRPVLDRLTDPALREEFLTEYATRLREPYPPRPYGTVLPFRRIFVVARKRL
ncbi:MAG: trans-aconitate 2-methyltransferase [Streptosporangiales bacterium]|nr:trans-aconitate 2-methyltransferase [Streptosporangiales bacterium]